MKFHLMKMIKYMFIPFGILYRFVYKSKNEILILMYHRVNDEINKELAVTKRSFNWHMNYLFIKGYKVISMDEACSLIRENSINDRYVVLTFDDGYEDFYINAFPVLRRYHFPSILYLVPGFIESDKTYWWDKDLGESKLLSWKQIEELNDCNLVDIGSHSLSHFDLDKLENEDLQYELETSKRILQDKTGKTIKHFSYPRGISCEEGEKKVKNLYVSGVLMQNGIKVTNNISINDITKLKRIAIQRSDGRYLFIARLKGWLEMEELARICINKIKSILRARLAH